MAATVASYIRPPFGFVVEKSSDGKWVDGTGSSPVPWLAYRKYDTERGTARVLIIGGYAIWLARLSPKEG